VGLEVVTTPLLLVKLLPVACPLASKGLEVSIPLYSRIRISGDAAAAVNVTVTAFTPAAAAFVFFA